MTTAADVQAVITRAEALNFHDEAMLNPQVGFSLFGIAYQSIRFYLGQLIEVFKQLFRSLATTEIQQIVDADFTGELLTFEQVAERYQAAQLIEDLRNRYGIDLVPPNGQSLGLWLSAASADIAQINTIYQAAQQTSQRFLAEIELWPASQLPSDPNRTGVLWNINTTAYPLIAALLNTIPVIDPNDEAYATVRETAAASALKLMTLSVVTSGSNLKVLIAPTHYPTDITQLFGYLSSWDYAGFAKRCIEADEQIYLATGAASVASRMWSLQNWLPTSRTLLRTDWSDQVGFVNRGVISIDPVHSLESNSPTDLILAYRARSTDCTPAQADALCHDEADCKDLSVVVATDNLPDWEWAGTPRAAQNNLPFLPKSILTGCVPARRSLARATIALWREIGIYQDYEEVTRLVNALEHGASLPNDESKRALFQFLHNIWHTTQATFATREVEYVAAMSSIIFDFNSNANVDVRIYRFFKEILTPVAEQSETLDPLTAQAYATIALGQPWDQYDPELYSPEVRAIISVGANRTFGSTEFNNLTDASQTQLINDKKNSTGELGWTAFLGDIPENTTPEDVIATGINGSPDGVFLLTPSQFNLAQSLEKR